MTISKQKNDSKAFSAKRFALLVLLSSVCFESVWAGQHDYFDSLVARPDFWKGYSLRPRVGDPKTSPYYENQYGRPKDGGYMSSNNADLYVTFDPVAEAAKVVIPGWMAYEGDAGIIKDAM